ncbi:MAG: DUF4160 domain-containing protein [Verrucomicrobia bacterium]|nr:DUF4160 domain-containing protein [Verrucomicrobiota bacterium]
MPELSRFYGIIVRMFVELIIAGSLPRKQQRLVETWAELHQEELMADWNLLIAGQCVEPIKPLN